jgi:C4-dicarboxylate transporter, DctQ subunit
MKIRRFLNEKLEEWLLVTALILLTLLVIAQVFVRFVINFSIGGTEELARYILIWISWIGASYAIQKNAHIKVEILRNMLNDSKKKILDLFSLLIFFGLALFLAIEGTNLVYMVNTTNQVSPSMGMPMWIIYLVIPIGGLLMSIRLIQQIISIFRSKTN